MKSSMIAKGDLPPLPPSASSTPSKFSDHQATVRNMPGEPAVTKNGPIHREPSDEYEDYGEPYEDAYLSPSQMLQESRGQVPLEDELPDTTMLDSVILPAIASVSIISLPTFPADIRSSFSSFLVFRHRTLASPSVPFSAHLPKPSVLFLV